MAKFVKYATQSFYISYSLYLPFLFSIPFCQTLTIKTTDVHFICKMSFLFKSNVSFSFHSSRLSSLPSPPLHHSHPFFILFCFSWMPSVQYGCLLSHSVTLFPSVTSFHLIHSPLLCAPFLFHPPRLPPLALHYRSLLPAPP